MTTETQAYLDGNIELADALARIAELEAEAEVEALEVKALEAEVKALEEKIEALEAIDNGEGVTE